MITRIRTTISITPETHAVFKRMAAAANMSVSRVMGDWLSDTSDGAEMIVLKMEEAKKAPIRVLNEMRAMLAGMSDGVDTGLEEIRQRSRLPGGASARASAADAGSPPLSNTGVLVPPSPPGTSSPKKVKKT
jgi:hypothetical protein